MSSWDYLKKFTSARVGIGRSGHGQPTKMVLDFQRAHAEARSSVLKVWNTNDIAKQLAGSIVVSSQALHREDYLKFPNKGRSLNSSGREKLQALSSKQTQSNYHSNHISKEQISDKVVFIISDGLSTDAIQNHFLNFWSHFIKIFQNNFPELSYKLILVPFGRVAISDEIGEILDAKMAVIFIGERPGLNSSDSLGIYITYNPKIGNSDAQRNCISNIRPPEGLSYELSALKLNYLMQESFRRQLSGVKLKDECFNTIDNLPINKKSNISPADQ
jgi:ethanolamine ammonia-lyase small subunit